MQHARPNRLRSAVAFAVLAALLGLVSLTGVTVTRAGPTDCAKCCHNNYADLFKCEQDCHQKIVDACNALATPEERQACKDVESARHVAAKDLLTSTKIACLAECDAGGTCEAVKCPTCPLP